MLVQALAQNLNVRRTFDAWEHRFMRVASPCVPRHATLTLYLSPARPAPQLRLLRNGRKVADFRQDCVQVDVQNGDVLSFAADEANPAWQVVVDHAGPVFVSPASGQVFPVKPGERMVVLLREFSSVC